MKKIILLFTIFTLSNFVAFSAKLPSKGYSGSSFSYGGGFLDEPTIGVSDKIGATNSVLGDVASIDACWDACFAKLMDCCGEDLDNCDNACFDTDTTCMEACEAYSLPVGSGFFFLLLLSGGYAGVKLRRKRKEA